MIELRTTSEGVLLPVHAQPGARRNGVVGERGGRLKVAVTPPPEQGKANDAILDVLAEFLKVKASQLSLARGATSRKKEVLVIGISAAEVSARLTTMPGC